MQELTIRIAPAVEPRSTLGPDRMPAGELLDRLHSTYHFQAAYLMMWGLQWGDPERRDEVIAWMNMTGGEVWFPAKKVRSL